MTERRVAVQADFPDWRRRGAPPGTMAWSEHCEVWEAYARKFRMSAFDQDAETIAGRGGFGKAEAEKLIGRPLRTWEPC